jgi:hypothetical protein
MNNLFPAAVRFMSMLLLCSLAISCEFSSDIEEARAEFRYPVQIGNRWSYHHEWDNYNFRPDTLEDRRPDMTFEHNVEVVKDTVLNENTECLIFEWSEPNYNDRARKFYKNDESGFYCYAHTSGASISMPKNAGDYQIKFAGKLFNDERQLAKYILNQMDQLTDYHDTIYFFDPPQTIYQYPVHANRMWLYADNLFKIWKKVVGEEKVTTSAGSFDCYKILWVYESNEYFPPDDFEIYEYVSDKGIIKKVLEFRNLAITSAESPEPIGFYDSRDEIILTGINF